MLEIVVWQSWEADCAECGRESLPREETTGERIVSDDGTSAWRPLCRDCAKWLGLED